MLLEAIPPSKTGAAVLAGACSLLGRKEFKLECLRNAAARSPDDTSTLGRLADALLLAINSQTFPCNGEAAASCVQEADRTARAIAKAEPGSWRPGYIVAKIFLAQGDAKAAAALLAKVCPAETTGQECARESVTAAISSGVDEVILTAADKYAARGCGKQRLVRSST